MRKLRVLGVFALTLPWLVSFGQTCTSNPTTIGSNTNFASISWTGAGGVSAAQCAAIANGTNTTTTANFFVDIANSTVVTISNNVTIHGTFDVTGGPGAALSVNGGGSSTTLHVTGDLGDNTNNGVVYNVQASTDHITVDGTVFGKNNNAFTGSGTISGGTLNVKNGTTCGSPCPATGGFTNCTSGDSFCTTNSIVLPVTLVSFSAASDAEKIALKWSTASELNFDYFSLQKSADGKSFNEIAQVKGHGTTNQMHTYSYEDNSPVIGMSYYRLTSIDFDGYRETFTVISAEYHGEKRFAISPNPSDGLTARFVFNFANDDSACVMIYNNVGSFIGSFKVSGTGLVNFDNPLQAGVYLAKYSSPTFSKTERFLVK